MLYTMTMMLVIYLQYLRSFLQTKVNCNFYIRTPITVYSLLFLDLHILQRRYTALLQSFPVTHLSTLECLQNFLTDGCICAVVESTDVSLTNKMMLDCMISKLTCKEDLLDFFDKLKEIKNADALTSIVNELLQGM